MKHTLGVDPLPGRKTESQFVIWPRPKRVTIDDLKNDANADLAAVLEGPREPGCVYWLAIFVGVMEAGVIDIQDGSAIRASSGASTLFVRNADDAWKVERG
jgi:hypothetical protein